MHLSIILVINQLNAEVCALSWLITKITVINICVPQNAKNFLANWATTSFSRATLFRELYCEVCSNLRYPMLATPHSKQSSIIVMISCEIMNDEQKGSHLVEQHLKHKTLQGNVTHKTWALRKETIMHGHDRHNTTTIIHNMSTTCFGQYYFWPSSGWIQLLEKTTQYVIWYSII